MRIESLADVEAFEQVPVEDRWRANSIYDLIRQSAETYKNRPALKFQATADLDETPRIVTYGALLKSVHQCAN
ncbi:MAG: acyl-CoA synthetase, partial [Pseudomonadota bacterium]